MNNSGRLVWVTREQRDQIVRYKPGDAILTRVVAAFDAAPEDAAEVIASKLPLGAYAVTQSIWAHEIAAALGVPSEASP